ncbi:MAG: discoidin domain-containing protein [Bacteroidaceae bacterium]|nr:discoidin domain-containing protein [Bacteroidaceae bacterium]
MSKKITSFLMLLVALFVSNTVKAQLPELELKSITPGVAVENFEPNTWYLLHQGRVSGGDGYCPAGEMPTQGGYMTDMGVGENIKKMAIDNINDGDLATAKAAYLVRFVPTDDNPAAYYIQFGTGNWLQAPNGTGNSKTIYPTDNVYDAGTYNIYAIDEAQPGYFALNVSDSRGDFQELIDNNGVGQTIVTWGSGQKTEVGGNSVWSIIEIELGDFSEKEALENELTALIIEYSGYRDQFVPGTAPGQYNPEAVAAFLKALEDYNPDNMDPDDKEKLTVAQLKEMIANLKAAYEAVLASKIPMTLATGYYRLKTAMEYTNTVTDPDTMEEEAKVMPKYAYTELNGSTINAKWGTPDDVDTDCPSLWHVTMLEDGTFDIVSAATDGRFDNTAQSTAVTLSKESQNMMAIEPITTTEEGITYVNIRVSTQAADNFFYLHQGGHSAGTGTGGNIVGWSTSYSAENGPGGTEWYFVPVDDATAAKIIEDYAPIRDRELMLAQYDSILANAKKNLEIAIDIKHVKLLQNANQLSTPYNEPSEGAIANLLDGDVTTFWHSNWSDGNVDGDIHYLQADLVNPVEEDIYITFTRRQCSNDHVTQLIIRGTNDPDAEKEACEQLLIWDTPFGSNTESFKSEPFSTNGYRYIRLYAATTTNNRGYWHMTELQMGYDTPNENAQVHYMGDLATNLQAVIDAQADLERDDIGIDEFNALKAAYDAFMAKFVDPTELRDVLAAQAETADIVVVGTDPGFWSADNGAGAFKALYDEAVAYDAKGDYTPEKSKNYVEQLTKQSQDIFASANKIQTGKWYKIRFAPEEDFEAHNWDKVAGNGSTNAQGEITIPSLFGKYVSVADYYEEEGLQHIDPIDVDEIGLGHQVYFLDGEDLTDTDAALFRFISVGDSAYIMQNKGTNMFLKAAGTSGAVTLSVHPSLFDARAIGYGLNVVSAKSITGENQNYLHAQVSHNVLVTWGPDFTPTAGSRSGFYIEEAEDVAADYDGTEFLVAATDGAISAYCFPVEVSVKAGENAAMWSVNSVDGNKIVLAKIEKSAIGGRPFFLIYGNTDDYDEELADDYDLITLVHGYDITATAPQDQYAFKGTYAEKTVGAGVVVAQGNALTITKSANSKVSANSAYIAKSEAYDREATLEVVFDENAPDGIQTALQNVSKSGAVYTVDGRLVSKQATLNDLQKFGKGMYILNGTKVIVK